MVNVTFETTYVAEAVAAYDGAEALLAVAVKL